MQNYKRLLVAIDLSDDAEQILIKAHHIAQQNNAVLDIIHVVEPIIVETSYDITPSIDVDLESTLVVRSKSFISGLVSKIGMTIDKVFVLIGSTKGQIHEIAEKQSTDLIVIGTHGRHGVGLLLGSTANAVLHGAKCDVLSVRVNSSH